MSEQLREEPNILGTYTWESAGQNTSETPLPEIETIKGSLAAKGKISSELAMCPADLRATDRGVFVITERKPTGEMRYMVLHAAPRVNNTKDAVHNVVLRQDLLSGPYIDRDVLVRDLEAANAKGTLAPHYDVYKLEEPAEKPDTIVHTN